MMDLIDQYIESYKKKRKFYETAGLLAAAQLEQALQSAGIRAIVTTRVKAVDRLRSKVNRRMALRKIPYKSVREIYTDIVDLAGVRISLYFPGDREKVNSLINDLFVVSEIKQFPEQSEAPTYNKRFSGYWANHYHIRLMEENVEPSQKRFCSARIEIQVASVLMHAWSEVEHDLVYKPLQGNLSDEELAIIDELNGLVLSGEIALERLQTAGNQRILSQQATFGSQYELAAYLYNYLSCHFSKADIELRMGNIQLLFHLLDILEMNNVCAIEPVLNSVKFKKDRRTISQQIIDQIISGNIDRYKVYQALRTENTISDSKSIEIINVFFSAWVPLEAMLNQLSEQSTSIHGAFHLNAIKQLNILDQETINLIASLRKLRNVLIHDIELPELSEIQSQTETTESLFQRLLAELNMETQLQDVKQ